MPYATAKLTVTIGCTDYFVETDFRYNPGEPEVRYYADGSGYPGSPAEVDCIECVKLIEWEEPIDGDRSNECPDNWAYYDRDGCSARIAELERAVCEELSGGTYDDELLEDADYPEIYYYE